MFFWELISPELGEDTGYTSVHARVASSQASPSMVGIW